MKTLDFSDYKIGRKFGVEFEVSPTLSKQQIGDLITTFEKDKGTNHVREVRVEGGPKGWADTYSNNYWHVKYDSTCGPIGKGKDYGWEVASYIGHNDTEALDIANLANCLYFNGVDSNYNCGLHIHADISDHSIKDVGVLLGRWVKVEKLVVSSCPIRRMRSKFCKLLTKKKGYKVYLDTKMSDPELFWEEIRPHNLEVHSNNDKKVTLNSVGYACGLKQKNYHKNTIELRFAEALMDREHVYNWIKFYLFFIDQAKGKPMPESCAPVKSVLEGLRLIGLHAPEGTNLILSEDLYNIKLWFLNRIKFYSIRKTLIAEATNLLETMTNK